MIGDVPESEVASNMLLTFWEVVDELADINVQGRRWLTEDETFESSYIEDYRAMVDEINFYLIAEHAARPDWIRVTEAAKALLLLRRDV